MIQQLHLGNANDASLESGADRVFRLLGVKNYSEHESANYPKGVYFRGTTNDGAVLKFTYEDDVGYDDYQYWLIIDRADTESESNDKFIGRIASVLLLDGFTVCLTVDDDPGSDANHTVRHVFTCGHQGIVRTKEIVRVGPES